VAALGYDAIHLIAAAMEKAGGTFGPALRQAIAGTRGFPGVTGETTIDEHRNSSKPAIIMRMKQGRQFAEVVAP
jgi:branched-chain amino acid transport system substrate-binding protein